MSPVDEMFIDVHAGVPEDASVPPDNASRGRAPFVSPITTRTRRSRRHARSSSCDPQQPQLCRSGRADETTEPVYDRRRSVLAQHGPSRIQGHRRVRLSRLPAGERRNRRPRVHHPLRHRLPHGAGRQYKSVRTDRHRRDGESADLATSDGSNPVFNYAVAASAIVLRRCQPRRCTPSSARSMSKRPRWNITPRRISRSRASETDSPRVRSSAFSAASRR
jgi:hypothetical protein